MTKRTIKGNSEKNALKANAPAHCPPSIRKNFLTARHSIAQTLRVFWSSRFGIFIWLSLSLPPGVPHHLHHLQNQQRDGAHGEKQEAIGERHK